MVVAVCAGQASDALELSDMLRRRLNELCAVADIAVFKSGSELSAQFEPGVFSLLFIGVDSPDDDALGAAVKIRAADSECKIIIFSSDESLAQKAYPVRPSDFLLKPLTYDAFKKAFDRCESAWRSSLKYIEIKANRIVTRIRLAEIVSVEVQGKICIVHRANSDVRWNCSLGQMEKLLGGQPFVRCHKSFVININHVRRLEDKDAVMDDAMRIPLSVDRAEMIRSLCRQ